MLMDYRVRYQIEIFQIIVTGTCVPAPGTRAGAGIATVIVRGTVLTVPDGVGVNAGLVQGVDNCKKVEIIF
jgi:hypothetical protein